MSKNKQKKAKSVTSTEKIKPTKSKFGSLDSISVARSNEPMLFKRQNFMLIFAGIGLMIIGYLLMMGGSMPDANTWDEDIIYSARRTVLAPIFILAGLGVEIWAIFKK